MRKLILFIILIFIALLLTACDPMYVMADTTPITTILVSNTVPETVTVTSIVEVENTEKIEELELELQQYKDLINNLNVLLKNVYEVYGKLDNGAWTGGTGFSIKYNDKFYLITAGHVIDNEYGIFKNLGFKVNGKYIYPELIDYNVDYGIDYAIFYSDKITDGFEITDELNLKNLYILGYNNTIKRIDLGTKEGESGSPIIDINGNAIGIINMSNSEYTLLKPILDKLK